MNAWRTRWQPIATLLGIGDDTQLELMHLNSRTWRSSLLGASLMTLTLAWVFTLFAPESPLWLWAGLGGLAYATHGVICYLHETRSALTHIFKAWLMASLALSLVVGALWSSLAWWLPATPAIQLLAALAATMVSLGSAGASISIGTLMAICLPTLLVMPAGLWWHAHLPLAAAVGFGLELLIWRHGLVLHRNMLATIRQRRQVESLSHELGLKQTQLQEAERERGVLDERQRLLRDMHDGIGASLISALKMIEQGRMGLDGAAHVLRECLDDLRLVIDSLEPIEHDLVTLLATLRYRLGGRLEAAGITIDWAMADHLPPLPWLQAAQALEVLRIAQEALANVLKHAHATRVRVSLAMEERLGQEPAIVLRVEDNGIGFSAGEPSAGRGLRHMAQRAHKIGGRLSVEASTGHGARVGLALSVDGQASLQEARPEQPMSRLRSHRP